MKVYLANINTLPSVVDISRVEIQTLSATMGLSWVEIDTLVDENVELLSEKFPLFKGALFVTNLYDGVLYTATTEIIQEIVKVYGKKIPSKMPKKYMGIAPFYRK